MSDLACPIEGKKVQRPTLSFLHDAKVLLGWQRKVCALIMWCSGDYERFTTGRSPDPFTVAPTDEFSHLRNRQCGEWLGWSLCSDGGGLFVGVEGGESLGGVEDFGQ